MNLPNKLTVFRIFLIPLFIILINISTKAGILGALFVFIVASLTDQLDGYIARKYNLITNFGKLMDPLADKLLVSAAFISFVEFGIINSFLVVIIISREFIVTGIRLVLAESGEVVAASFYGKLKTVFQIVSVIFLNLKFYNKMIGIPDPYGLVISMIGDFTFYICVILTIISGLDYIIKNLKGLKEVL